MYIIYLCIYKMGLNFYEQTAKINETIRKRTGKEIRILLVILKEIKAGLFLVYIRSHQCIHPNVIKRHNLPKNIYPLFSSSYLFFSRSILHITQHSLLKLQPKCYTLLVVIYFCKSPPAQRYRKIGVEFFVFDFYVRMFRMVIYRVYSANEIFFLKIFCCVFSLLLLLPFNYFCLCENQVNEFYLTFL